VAGAVRGIVEKEESRKLGEWLKIIVRERLKVKVSG
jgi:hypothetical protein